MREVDYSVYLVTDHGVASQHPSLSFWQIVEAALKGGTTCVQLRMKGATPSDVLTIARELQPMVRSYQAALIINDHVEVACEVEADAVHIGQSDMSIPQARCLVGQNMIIGVSARTLAEAFAAEQAGADYIGVGPVFATRTKVDAGPPIGPELFAKICSLAFIPVVAIGGMKLINAKRILDCGADGLAIVSAIMAEDNPAVAASRFANIVSTHPRIQAKKMEDAVSVASSR